MDLIAIISTLILVTDNNIVHVSLYPLRNMHSETIIAILEKYWIPCFGFPSKIVTDGGPYFTGHEMKKFLNESGIDQHVTRPYHAQSNGLVERYFFTIKDMIFARAQREWDEVKSKRGQEKR